MGRSLNPTSQPPRQRALPIARAIEIAYKNIRLRLGRSMLVTSSIALALGFLASILFSQCIQQSMREWMQNRRDSSRFVELRTRRATLQQQLPALASAVRTASPAASGKKAKAGGAAAVSTDDAQWTQLRKTTGSLPLSPDRMTATQASGERGKAAVTAWQAAAVELSAIRAELNSPDQLQVLLKSNGVPSTAAEVASDRLQTRWLVALAMLVAFIGILNAMLMSVTERFREIGTMKCLGALDGFIIRLFLLESFFQGIVGTVVGVVAGGGISLLVATIYYGRFAWRNPPIEGLLLASLVCLGVGMVLTVAGALYPAWQAARMQPIAAMRVDA